MKKLVNEISCLSKESPEPSVIIIDSIMGSGKTSWAIQYMNNSSKDKNFLYITPFLTEIQRIKDSVTQRTFSSPEPKGNQKGGKLDNLKQLILQKKDIAATHALFQKADDELIELIKAGNYTLILDEVMNVLEQCELNKDDFKWLCDSGMVLVDEETGLIQWNNEGEYQETRYKDIKTLAESNNLYYFENTILFWTFPISVFKAFKEVYIMTYLFECQQQKYYYDMYKINYDYKSIKSSEGSYTLIDYKKTNEAALLKLKSLITVYEGKLNNIGEDKFALSNSWFKKNKNEQLIKKLQNNATTYFKNNVKTPTKLNMWTCFKDDKNKLKGKGYTKGFVSVNARATNEFKEKESLAYLVNRFMHPYEKKFFISKGITVDEDMFALSELLQWIWRSRIRDGLPINIYIPSNRMRNLLKQFLL